MRARKLSVSPGAPPTSAESTQATAQPRSAVRRSRRSSHQRSRSVHFPTEPVARDVQREMEQELQRWVQPALEDLFPFKPSARGAISVKQCTTATTTGTPHKGGKLVLKTVAMTLPPAREATVGSALSGFSSTDLSSDLSGHQLPNTPSELDSAWSQAQLLPDASVRLFDQVGKTASHVASVVDVFTLASMLRSTEPQSQSGKLGELERSHSRHVNDHHRSPHRPQQNRPGDGHEDTHGLVRMPKVSAQDMQLRGWAIADTTTAVTRHRSTTAGNTSIAGGDGGYRGSFASLRTPAAPAAAVPPLPPPPPHPTVFLYAREYVEGVDTLEVLLEERWGRDRLPITVMPRWAHYGHVTNSKTATAAPAAGADLRRLEDHVTRWLSGRAKAERRKRRYVEERAVAETALRGSAMAAAVSEDSQRLTEHDAADLVWAIAGALDGLHRGGTAHGNVKPSNVLVYQWDPTLQEAAMTRRKVCLTDQLLPLLPDALLEPGAVLSLPGWRSRETRPYACVKPHDASVLPHMLGGGAAGAPADDPAAYSISGCWFSTGMDAGDDATTLEGGVDGLPAAAYEALLLQHFVPPERVLVVQGDEGEEAARSGFDSTDTSAMSGAHRLWVDLTAADAAGDMYGVGVLLWEMVTGRLPPLPPYRSVVRGMGKTSETATADHAHGLPRSHAEVMVRAVLALAEARAAGVGDDVNQKAAKRLKELSAFLHSELAQTHLPLVLALARAGDVRVATMDLLLRLLHRDPKHRLSLAELRHHVFFRTYGSRRHELRRQHELAQRAGGLASRRSMRAADGRALMPRQMGALAGVAHEVRQPLERCRSEGMTTTTAAAAAAAVAEGSGRRGSTAIAAEADRHRTVVGSGGKGGASAAVPMARTQSAYAVPFSVVVGQGPEPHRRPSDATRRAAMLGGLESDAFVGSSSPARTRRGSSNSSSSRRSSPSARPSSALPAAAPRRKEDSPADSVRVMEGRGHSLRVRPPSLPLSTAPDEGGSPSQSLARTTTFRGGRRWTVTRMTTEVMSPLDEDSVSGNSKSHHSTNRGASSSPLRQRGSFAAEGMRRQAVAALPLEALRDDTADVRLRSASFSDGQRCPSLTPKASWVGEAARGPLLLSVPSRRLAPLVADSGAAGDLDRSVSKHPLGPRRPAVRIRPGN